MVYGRSSWQLLFPDRSTWRPQQTPPDCLLSRHCVYSPALETKPLSPLQHHRLCEASLAVATLAAVTANLHRPYFQGARSAGSKRKSGSLRGFVNLHFFSSKDVKDMPFPSFLTISRNAAKLSPSLSTLLFLCIGLHVSRIYIRKSM